MDASPAVVLFDDESRRGSGWACNASLEPYPVTGTHDLGSDHVWLTNLGYNAFTGANLHASNRYRHGDYLRVRLPSLAAEMGLIGTEANYKRWSVTGREAALAVQQIYSAVMAAAWSLGLAGFPRHMLSVGFRDLFYTLERQPSTSSLLDQVFYEINSSYLLSERRHFDRASRGVTEVRVAFTRHRYLHAEQICDQPLPSGQWRPVQTMTNTELERYQAPALLKVKVRNMAPELSALVNFGGIGSKMHIKDGMMQRDAAPREWITLPEYLLLSQYADIEVLEILEADQFVDNPMRSALSSLGPLQIISPAFNLCCESIWSAPLRSRTDHRVDQSPAAGWIRAIDRILCLQDAMDLIQKDHLTDVTTMSFGKILVQIPDLGAALGDWLKTMVLGTPLMPPIVRGSSVAVDLPEQASQTELLQALYLYGDVDTLLENDLFALGSV